VRIGHGVFAVEDRHLLRVTPLGVIRVGEGNTYLLVRYSRHGVQ
jgi:hypothetical protein